MEQARTLEAVAADESPLAHARLKRQLTIDEAAKRAGVSPEEVQWLEEGSL
jgi:transcriptional regulator with XRE-family HTH domain